MSRCFSKWCLTLLNNLIDNSCWYVCLTGPLSYFIQFCSYQKQILIGYQSIKKSRISNSILHIYALLTNSLVLTLLRVWQVAYHLQKCASDQLRNKSTDINVLLLLLFLHIFVWLHAKLFLLLHYTWLAKQWIWIVLSFVEDRILFLLELQAMVLKKLLNILPQ